MIKTTGDGDKPLKGIRLSRFSKTVVETTAYGEKPLSGFFNSLNPEGMAFLACGEATAEPQVGILHQSKRWKGDTILVNIEYCVTPVGVWFGLEQS